MDKPFKDQENKTPFNKFCVDLPRNVKGKTQAHSNLTTETNYKEMLVNFSWTNDE